MLISGRLSVRLIEGVRLPLIGGPLKRGLTVILNLCIY